MSHHHGRCLCGSVDYVVHGDLRAVIDCHCERCRRITGHHMAATRAERERIVIGSADTLSWFHPADDPNVGYGFCSTCGSSLFWRDSEESSTWSICAGTLDQPTGLSTEIIYFASEAGDYHRLDPRIVQLATE